MCIHVHIFVYIFVIIYSAENSIVVTGLQSYNLK